MRKKEAGGYRSAALFLRRAEESKQVNRGSFFLGKSEGPPSWSGDQKVENHGQPSTQKQQQQKKRGGLASARLLQTISH